MSPIALGGSTTTPNPVQAALLHAYHNPTPPPPAGTLPKGTLGDLVEAGSPEWMATISASKVAAILGVSPYTSPYTLWHQIRGLVSPGEDKAVFRRGHLLEPAVAAWFAQEHPEWEIATTGTWTHAEREHQTASPDRLVLMDGRDDPAVETVFDLLEIKSTTKDHEWGKPGTAEVPLYYWVQAMWQMDTVGVTRCHFAIIGSFLEFSAYVVDYDPVAARIIREQVDAFHASLSAATPPALDQHPTTFETVRALHPDVTDQVVAVGDEGVRYVRAKRAADAADAELTAAKAALADAMGDAKAATWGGVTIATRRAARAGATPTIYAGRNLDAIELPAEVGIVGTSASHMVEVTAHGGDIVADLEATLEQLGETPTPEIVDGADAAAAVDQADEVAAFPASSAAFAPGSPELVDLRTTWIRQRIATVGEHAEGRTLLVANWPATVGRKPPWTDADIDAIAEVLDAVEGRIDLPFGPSDPGLAAKLEAERAARAAAVPPPLPERPAPDEGELVDDAMVAELRQRTAKLAPHQRDEGASWVAQARRAGKPLGQVIDGHWSERSYAINTAIYACASALVDEDPEITRQTMTAALSFVIGEDVHPVWPIGELFASLTTDEAVRLAEFAAAFAEGDTEIGAVITAALTKAA